MTGYYQLPGLSPFQSPPALLFHFFPIHGIQLKLTAKSAFRQHSRLVQIKFLIRFQAAFFCV